MTGSSRSLQRHEAHPRSGIAAFRVGLLRETELATVHTGEVGLASASDADILEYARRQNRVVVTLDADFHMLLALSGARSQSVIHIRIEGLRAEDTVRAIRGVLDQCAHELNQGAVVTVQEHRLRIRLLPLV